MSDIRTDATLRQWGEKMDMTNTWPWRPWSEARHWRKRYEEAIDLLMESSKALTLAERKVEALQAFVDSLGLVGAHGEDPKC